jgi:alanine-synthesizing transaminase
VLNYPHNPTTRTVELDFFREVVKIARRYNIMLIQDFAYGLTTFGGYKAPSILQVRGAKDLAVEFFTLSKGWNMAGWRIGFAVGNRQMLAALARVKGYYDYGIFQPIQIAAIIAMRCCDEHVARQAAIYQQRRDVLCRQLGRIGWKVRRPKASMFLWVPIPRKFRRMGSMNVALKLLEEANVAVAPGIGFGEEGEGHLRIALVENEQRLAQAVRQIGRATRNWTT